MKVGIYARVSTDDQGVDMQTRDLRAACAARGWMGQEYLDEGVSAAARERPAFERLLAAARAGEIQVVMVWRFDRASRSTIELLALLDKFRAYGVEFVSLREQVDTTTPAGRLMFTMIAALAEFERALIRDRVSAGMAAAKARGVRLGALPKLTPEQQTEARVLRAGGATVRALAARYGVGLATIHKICKE